MRQYQERVKRLLKRERKTTRKLKELGIEYDFPQYVSRCELNRVIYLCMCQSVLLTGGTHVCISHSVTLTRY